METLPSHLVRSQKMLTSPQIAVLILGLLAIFQVTLICFVNDLIPDNSAVQEAAAEQRREIIRTFIFRQMTILLDGDRLLHTAEPPSKELLLDRQKSQECAASLRNKNGNSELDLQMRKAMSCSDTVVNQLNKAFLESRSPNLTDDQKKIVRKSIREEFRSVREEARKCFNRLAELNSSRHPQASNKNQQLLFYGLLAGCTVNLIALLLVQFRFFRTSVTKLAKIEDNCSTILWGQTSYVPMADKDVFSLLDQSLHGLAVSLADAAHKHQELFDHAHDVLCYLSDDTFSFTSVNEAAATVFQQKPKPGDLVDSVIFHEDRALARKNLQEIVNARSKPPFEMCPVEGKPFMLRVIGKNGNITHTVWTVQYIPNSKTLFCVVHDFTDQIEAQNSRKQIAQMVNHDLRSPLNAIRVIYSIWESSVQLSSAGQRSLGLATANTDRMLSLINELLDIEKIEAGHMIIEKKPFLLGEVVEFSMQAVQNLASAKSVKITHTVPADLLIDADEHRIIQVLVNLLSNAIKFSPLDGAVEISSVVTGDFVEVAVSDNGRGIPADKIEQIFERFHQVQRSDASAKGGTGLGLAICKSLVELHGGTIAVESTEGVGSKFYFRLPFNKI